MAALRLTSHQFAAWANPLRSALESQARSYAGDNAEDVVSDVYTHALMNLAAFDAADGVDGLARWMQTQLRWRLGHYRRSQARDTRTIENARWELMTGPDENSVLSDVELINEAKLRLRLTNLTDLQIQCLAGRLRGEKRAIIARRVKLPSVEAVDQHLRAAVKKLRACPIDVIQEADIDSYAWLCRGKITRYFKPPSTGGGLAREALKRLN